MNTVTVSPKFQVVIPRAVRERLQLRPGTKMMVVESGGGVRLVPMLPASALRGMARGIDTTVADDPDRPL